MLNGLDELTLLAVQRLGGRGYAGAVTTEIERAGFVFGMRGVHQCLRRLEERGLVESHLGNPTPRRGGRSTRCYVVTERGLAAIASLRRARETLTQAAA